MGSHFGRLAVAALFAAVSIAFGTSAAHTANLDEACGGPDKIKCNSALFCRKEVGQCGVEDAKGTCEKAPDFCIRISRPVCGCNGKIYPNECEARRAKMAIDHTGACKKPPGTEPPPPAKGAKKKKSSK
jgi:hypothetical protein